jgi:hypothetical protein
VFPARRASQVDPVIALWRGSRGISRTNYSADPDAFVTKINSTGSAIVFSTTLGGSSYDGAGRIVLDASSNVWIAGATSSADFPVKSPFQPAFAGGWDDGYVAKLSPQGSSLLASTYFGGSGRDYMLADLEGPRVGSVAATPAVIWPPNREMIPVTVTVADVSDACSGPVTCRIDSVTSNEAPAE